jgi:hypothetical protein
MKSIKLNPSPSSWSCQLLTNNIEPRRSRRGFATTLIMITTHPNFTLAEGLEVQEDQLHKWSTILTEQAMAELRKEANKQNKHPPSHADGNYVWRGVDIDRWICNNLMFMFE